MHNNCTHRLTVNSSVYGLLYNLATTILLAAHQLRYSLTAVLCQVCSSKTSPEIDNKRHQRMLEKIMYYNLDISYIKGVTNKIAICLSRLTHNKREAQHFPIA